MSHTATYSSPLGLIVLESDGEMLTGLQFLDTPEIPQQAIETILADKDLRRDSPNGRLQVRSSCRTSHRAQSYRVDHSLPQSSRSKWHLRRLCLWTQPQETIIGIRETFNVEYHRHKNKEPRRFLFEALKMAATYSPTMRSTIGVAELNDPVRNGKGWDLSAITT